MYKEYIKRMQIDGFRYFIYELSMAKINVENTTFNALITGPIIWYSDLITMSIIKKLYENYDINA